MRIPSGVRWENVQDRFADGGSQRELRARVYVEPGFCRPDGVAAHLCDASGVVGRPALLSRASIKSLFVLPIRLRLCAIRFAIVRRLAHMRDR